MTRASHILVVDDNEMNRDMLSRRLQREGYSTETADSGQKVLEMLRNAPHRYDVVLLDIMMPGMNGYEVLEHLKADAKLQHIPVIVVSALDEMDSVVRCIELGAEDYLHKPVNPVLLHARLRPTLERKHSRDTERRYLKRIEAEKRRADELLNVVIPIGIGLSAERNFNQLLELIVLQAMRLANADGGTLYLRDDDRLIFEIVRNDSLSIAMGGTTRNPISFPALQLHGEDGVSNEANIATYCTLHNALVSIPDAYETEDFDFSGTRAFDQRTGYRTTSVLALPLQNPRGDVIGVLQLINAHDAESNDIIPFDVHTHELSQSLALLAASALEASMRESQLRKEIEELRIVIDEQRKMRSVEEITDSEYFRDLQGRVNDMRKKRPPTSQ
jgi:DNA-binding response OmpR family regulator